ncbi:MAG: histidine phosphatase family protein, partial [Actinomycetota bacterium]|nr:histidine phosphatase family protein [Actinomycetota bacterium]
FLVRHGATAWNHSKKAQGQADIELNDAGYRQAIATAEELSHVPVAAVYSSDLKRAYDTAEPIAKTHGLEVRTSPAFREIDQGEWEGLHVDEIRRRWPDLWGPARHYSTRPGGESPAQVRERALAGLEQVVRAHPDGSVVVVSHGGTIRWLSAEALGYDDRRSARIRGVGNGAIVRLNASIQEGKLVLSDLERLDGNTTDLDDPND